jgi:hypothetical protein
MCIVLRKPQRMIDIERRLSKFRIQYCLAISPEYRGWEGGGLLLPQSVSTCLRGGYIR